MAKKLWFFCCFLLSLFIFIFGIKWLEINLLKSNGLITTPSFRVMSASDSFYDKTTSVNQMWQTDFTYFKIFGWGWYYLSTILDDYSRFIVSWELWLYYFRQ